MLSFVIRWLHVGGMAVTLGGAVLVLALALRAGRRARAMPDDAQGRLLLYAAASYELLFWPALALLVVTGIGNLGAFGAALPGPDTAWGLRLALKLIAVVLLLPLSLLRTLVCVRLSGASAGSWHSAIGQAVPAASAPAALAPAGVLLAPSEMAAVPPPPAGAAAAYDAAPAAAFRLLALLYAGTALGLAVILLLAVSLAHA